MSGLPGMNCHKLVGTGRLELMGEVDSWRSCMENCRQRGDSRPPTNNISRNVHCRHYITQSSKYRRRYSRHSFTYYGRLKRYTKTCWYNNVLPNQNPIVLHDPCYTAWTEQGFDSRPTTIQIDLGSSILTWTVDLLKVVGSLVLRWIIIS